MKKILLIAASAVMVFASCKKVEIIYDNPDPQEIALFSVAKKATKAPVTGTVFSTGDNMRVSAYLADVTNSTPGSYFENILFKFKENDDAWIAGQYWPITASTLNFVAVTQKGGGVDLTDSKISWDNDNEFTVTVDYNTAQTYNQSDIMYACNRATNAKVNDVIPNVTMEFKHALAWINFAFTTNAGEDVVTVNSVELTTKYNGELTITPTNYTSSTEALSVSASWDTEDVDNISLFVPNADNNAAAGNLSLTEDSQTYGNGLLVVPCTQDENNSFTVTYTITQNGIPFEYTYTHSLDKITWAEAKKYTYNISINLSEIKIAPTIEETDWTDGDTDPITL